MKRNFVIFLILISSSLIQITTLHAFSISGQVHSQETGEKLAGANIFIAGSSIGVTSDRNGYFTLTSLPAGKYTVQVNYIGYSQQSHFIHLADADTSLSIGLNQAILSGPIVSVSAIKARSRITPVTFSEIDKQTLKAKYTTQDMPELLSEMPSTTFYSETGSGMGYNYLSIRGFGQRRISVLINGIPQNDPEDHNTYWVNFPDFAANVEEIQVQRGAGSAFYGPAAIGGSINILTNYFSPQHKFTAYVGAGSYNTRKVSLSYNSGLLNDRFVLYGRASNLKTDGYRERGWVDFQSYFIGGALYAKNQNLRLHFYGGPIKDGLIYTGLPKLVNNNETLRRKNYSFWEFAGDVITKDSLVAYDRRDDEVESFNQPHLELLHEYKINNNLSVNNSLFYIHGYGYFDYDGSWGTPEYFRLTPEYGFADSLVIPSDALIRAYVDNKQIGWLPQFSWRDGNDEFVIGAELRAHRSLHWGRLQKGNGLPANVMGEDGRHYYEYRGGKDVISAYMHQTREIRPDLILMADLQYAYKRYKLYDEKFLENDFELHYNFMNPRIGLNYNLSPTSNTYFSMSHTTREPRLKNYYDAAEASTPASWGSVIPQFELNEDGNYNVNKPLVKPEALTGLELGYTYHAEKVNGFINWYFMNFTDEIIKKGALDRFGQPITGNAEQTVHQGIELGGKLQISAKFSISGNFVYSDNKLVSYSVYDWEGTEIKLDGNPIAGFPDVLANLRLTYSWNRIYASLAGRYVGKMYTDNFANEDNTVDPFNVFNLNLHWNIESLGYNRITLQAHINNLLNNKYLAHGEGDAYFPAATRNGFIGIQFEY